MEIAVKGTVLEMLTRYLDAGGSPDYVYVLSPHDCRLLSSGDLPSRVRVDPCVPKGEFLILSRGDFDSLLGSR